MSTEYSIYIIRSVNRADRACYIGCTQNLRARAAAHKHRCKTGGSSDYKLYEAIRAGGGWAAYQLVELDRFSTASPLEARQRERAFYDLYSPSLNTNRPYVTREEHALQHKLLVAAHYRNNKPAYLARSAAQAAAKRALKTTITITVSC